jgi:hypothetical protein
MASPPGPIKKLAAMHRRAAVLHYLTQHEEALIELIRTTETHIL